jgi:hypothetical protein
MQTFKPESLAEVIEYMSNWCLPEQDEKDARSIARYLKKVQKKLDHFRKLQEYILHEDK